MGTQKNRLDEMAFEHTKLYVYTSGKENKYNSSFKKIGLSGPMVDWLQSLKQFFINVSYSILVASLTLMALF